MPGGNKNIKPEDGKQFEKGNKAAEKWTEAEALKLANDLLTWMLEADENIFFDEFLYLACDESKYAGKIYSTILPYLSNKFSSFSNILNKCRDIEKTKLKKFGAFDKLNASIVKFLLSAEYGMADTSKVNIGGQKDNPLTHLISEPLTAKEIKEFNDQIEKQY